MRAFTDADYSRLADLENFARLADLEIERTPLRDVGKLDIANMTAGEIVTLANVMEAVHVLTDAFKRDAQEYDQAYAGYSPATSERRTMPFDNRAARFAPSGPAYNYSTQADAPTDQESREALAKLREYLVNRLGDNGAQVNTVNGPINVSDVPRDENGTIIESWLNENCTCDDHEKKRIEADKANKADPSIAAGLYL